MFATKAATEAASEQRIEVVGERRPSYDAAFRARVVEASLAPWGAGPIAFIPVRVPGPPEDRCAVSSEGFGPKVDGRTGRIEIDLPDGIRLRVDAAVDDRALRRVLAVLKELP